MTATVTGITDLTVLDKTLPGTTPPVLAGALAISGASFGMKASTSADVVASINRHTPQTTVVASIDGDGHLVLTSDRAITVDGDTAILASLGLTGGTTKPAPAPSKGFLGIGASS